jgi:hypothetical protein
MLAAPSALALSHEYLLINPGDDETVPGFVGGDAIFEFFNPGDPTGSGVFDPFVRINTNKDVEKGYNTSYRKLEFDENSSPIFTKDYELGAVPVVEVEGKLYREFQCDVNQNNKKGDDFYISLDQLELYVTDTAGLIGYDFGTDATLVWQMNDPANPAQWDWVKINSLPNAGSGRRDFRVLIPAEDLVGGKYVILFSQFGKYYPNNGGYEEWGVRLDVTPPPPDIDVVKYVSVDGGATWDDSNESPGPNFFSEDNPILFKIVVTNTGGTVLENIELTDVMYKDGIEITPPSVVPNKTTLIPGESDEIIVEYWVAGCIYQNIVTAVGVCAESGASVDDVDSAWFHYIW